MARRAMGRASPRHGNGGTAGRDGRARDRASPVDRLRDHRPRVRPGYRGPSRGITLALSRLSVRPVGALLLSSAAVVAPAAASQSDRGAVPHVAAQVTKPEPDALATPELIGELTPLGTETDRRPGADQPSGLAGPTTTGTVRISGWFTTIFGPQTIYSITDDQGRRTNLLLDVEVARPGGGLLAFDRKRVTIMGEPAGPDTVRALSTQLETAGCG